MVGLCKMLSVAHQFKNKTVVILVIVKYPRCTCSLELIESQYNGDIVYINNI